MKSVKKMCLILMAAVMIVFAVLGCSSCGSVTRPEDIPETEDAPPPIIEVVESPEVTEDVDPEVESPEPSEVPEEDIEIDATTGDVGVGGTVQGSTTGGGSVNVSDNTDTISPTTGGTNITYNPGSVNTNRPTVTPEPTAEVHTHSWQPVYTIIHHEEVGHFEEVIIQAAWDEEEYERVQVCNACGYACHGAGNMVTHIVVSHDNNSSFHTELRATGNIIHHDAVTEQRWIVDSPAYDEQVITGYYCTCGATKAA